MSHFISSLTPHLEVLGSLIYWVIFFASFFESLAFVGYIVPGTALMILSGVFVSQGIMSWNETVLVITLGGILGDAASFYLGKRGTSLFGAQNKIFKLDYLEQGEKFFKKHGNKSVFLARFFGPIRPIVPFVAGTFRMRRRTFFIYNILSALIVAPIYVSMGYFFGQNSERFEHYFGRIGLFGTVLGVIIIGLYLFKRSLVKEGSDFLVSIRSFLATLFRVLIFRPRIEYFLEHHPKGTNFLRQRTNTFNLLGLPLTLVTLIVVILVSAWFGVIGNLINVPAILRFDSHVQNFLFYHRHVFFIYLFWIVTYVASGWLVPFVTVAGSAVMWWKKRHEYIMPFYVTVVGSSITALLLKHFTARPRPIDVAVYHEHLFSFPSLHSSAAIAVYGFLTYFLVSLCKEWKNKLNIVFGGVTLILVVGFSRLYLGVHFFSDVMGGYILGILWLWIGVSLVRIHRKSIN